MAREYKNMSRAEELFEQMPAMIVVDGEKYELSITKTDDPYFSNFKYTAKYGRWSNTSEKCPDGFPADVFTDYEGEPGWVYTIHMAATMEEALEDLLGRIKYYIPDENGIAPITKMNIKRKTNSNNNESKQV